LSYESAFGLIRFIYLNLVITAPALGALVLYLAWRWRRRPPDRRMPWWAIAAVLPTLALPAVGVYASFIEPFRLQLETAEIPLDPARAGRGPLRIGVLSDIQTDRVGDHERSAVDRLMAQKPDLILMPGDVFQGGPGELERELPALQDLLRRLSAPGGIFCVEGNTDSPKELRRILEGTAVRLLENGMEEARVGDRRILIGGLGPRCSAPEAQKVMAGMETLPGGEDIRILLAHFPDAALGLKSASRIDLVVAGHTHGGQICVPFIGPLLTLSRVPRSVAAGGLHDLDGRRIYVSRGLGMERGNAPRIRFLCPPEITLLTLKTRA